MKIPIHSLLAAGVLIQLLGSCDFAKMHDLTPEPGSDFVLEILDQSTLYDDTNRHVRYQYPAYLYASFKTTQPEWIDYIYAEFYLEHPDGNATRFRHPDVLQHSDGNYLITLSDMEQYIEQGTYSLELQVGEDGDVDDHYYYDMNLSIDGTGGADLKVLEGSYAGTPNIVEQHANFTVAVSDTGDTIYIQPNDEYSSQKYLTFFLIYQYEAMYLGSLAPGSTSTSKWTALSVSDLVAVDYPHSLSNFRSSSYWGVETYSSTRIDTSWGTVFRSEYKYGTKSSYAPTGAEVMNPSVRSAASSTSIVPPLAEVLWETGALP